MAIKEKCKNYFLSLKNKLINLKTNQVIMICSLLCVIYLISGYWKWLEIGVSLCALIFMIFISIQNAFCIFMFLHSFTLSNIGHDSCFMVTLIGFCLVLLVKYWIGVKQGKYPFYKKLVYAILTFYIVTTLLSFFQSFYRGAWLYFTYLPMAYFLFAMKNEFNIAQGMNYMFGGLITSCALALLTLFLPNFQYEVITQERFHAFINNANYLYMRSIFVLSYYTYRNLNNRLSNFKFLTILFICSMITLSTISKTGISMLALLIFAYIILSLKQDFKKRIKYVMVFCLIIAIFVLIGHKFILSIFNRFLESSKSANFLNTLLSHRDEIWSLYLDAIFDSSFKALFGHGLLTKQVFVANVFGPTETHNFYIWLLYRFGIIGIVALGYIVYLFIKLLNKDKPKFIAYLPIIYLLLESFCDNTMKCYNITYFFFAFMILFMECKEKSITQQTRKVNKTKKVKD